MSDQLNLLRQIREKLGQIAPADFRVGKDAEIKLVEEAYYIADDAIRAVERAANPTCPRCAVALRKGTALRSTLVAGIPDFPGQTDNVGQTMHHGGPGTLVDVLKCPICGYSRTAPLQALAPSAGGTEETPLPLARGGEPSAVGADVIADAERWRALIECARITAMGCAGLNNPLPENYAHLTVNLWTKHPEPSHEIAVEWLNKFVDIAVWIRRRKRG